MIEKAIKNYQRQPKKIIVYYYDGVKNQMIQACRGIELALIEITLEEKIRIFNGSSNVDCGAVVDNTITSSEWEFFLMSTPSLSSDQGTNALTKYNVVFNTTDFTLNDLESWSFKNTHLYFGKQLETVAVPAVLAYATKLGHFVSKHLHSKPHKNLDNILYYL